MTTLAEPVTLSIWHFTDTDTDTEGEEEGGAGDDDDEGEEGRAGREVNSGQDMRNVRRAASPGGEGLVGFVCVVG